MRGMCASPDATSAVCICSTSDGNPTRLQMLRAPRADLAAPVAADVAGVLDACMHAVRGLERLHAAGAAHGDISDASLLYLRGAGGRPEFRFATLGRLDDPAPTLEQLAALRPDLPAFVAPEVTETGAPTAKADVWAMAVVLAYCLRPALPHVADGPLVRPACLSRSIHVTTSSCEPA